MLKLPCAMRFICLQNIHAVALFEINQKNSYSVDFHNLYQLLHSQVYLKLTFILVNMTGWLVTFTFYLFTYLFKNIYTGRIYIISIEWNQWFTYTQIQTYIHTSVKIHLLLSMCFLYVINKISKSKISTILKYQ